MHSVFFTASQYFVLFVLNIVMAGINFSSGNSVMGTINASVAIFMFSVLNWN